MNNFWALAGYEYKKLIKRKIVWITLVILAGIGIFSACSPLLGTYYIEGVEAESHYDMIKSDIAQARELSGRKMDDALFAELRKTGKRMPNSLYDFVTEAGMKTNITAEHLDDITEEKLYALREQNVRSAWREAQLTQGEQNFLEEMETEIEKPLEYQYAGGYRRMLSLMYSAGMMTMLFIAVCIPSVFTEEHVRRTDQLNLSSCFGKKHLFAAKVFTAVTCSMAGAAVVCLSMLVPTAVVYGMDGFHTRLQVLYPLLSWDLEAGTALFIMIGLLLLLAAVFSIIAVVAAEKLKGSTAAMALLMGLILFAMFFSVPQQYRLPAQIWDSLPMRLTEVQNMLGSRLVPFFQTYLPMWKAMPVFYLPVILVLLCLGYRIYSRCQIGGR